MVKERILNPHISQYQDSPFAIVAGTAFAAQLTALPEAKYAN